MRILKYIFLLILLLFVGLTVFVITQKGDYNISRSQIFNFKKSVVYNYVNDYKNWELFAAWNEKDGTTTFLYPTTTSGKNSSFSWQGSSDGYLKTIDLKENEQLLQKMEFNGTETEGKWTFKDTLGKTKVTWETKGKMSVSMKIKAFLNGGIENVIGDIYEKSLFRLKESMDTELNKFSIKPENIILQPKTFYLSKTINSNVSKIEKNIKILIPDLISFFKKNKMVMHGKPFVIYNSTDLVKNRTNLSVCIPVKDSIHIMSGSDIESGKLDETYVLKTTLTGDYSHVNKANKKILDYLFEKGLKRNFLVKETYVYKHSFIDEKQPSKYKTEIFYPIFYKPIPKPVVVNKILTDSIN